MVHYKELEKEEGESMSVEAWERNEELTRQIKALEKERDVRDKWLEGAEEKINDLKQELKQKDAEIAAIREGVEKLEDRYYLKEEILDVINDSGGEVPSIRTNSAEERVTKPSAGTPKPEKKGKNEHPGCSAPWY